MTYRFIAVLAFLVILSVAAFGSDTAAQKVPGPLDATFSEWTENTDLRLLDQFGSRKLLQATGYWNLAFSVEEAGRTVSQGFGWSPVLGSNGTVYYVSVDLSLRQIDATGIDSELLPRGRAGGMLKASPTRRYLAYVKPFDIPDGDTVVAKYGVGIYDTEAGKEIVSYVLPGLLVQPVGWHGTNLLVRESDHNQWDPHTTLKLLSVKGRATLFLDRLPQTTTAIEQSFEGNHLAYQAFDGSGTVVVDLSKRSFGILADIERPVWAPTGLTALKNGRRVLVNLKQQ